MTYPTRRSDSAPRTSSGCGLRMAIAGLVGKEPDDLFGSFRLTCGDETWAEEKRFSILLSLQA